MNWSKFCPILFAVSGAGMPEVKRFGGFKVLIFFRDENPPHVHVKGPDFAAKLRISNGEVIAGEAPGKVLRQARRWMADHREELAALWRDFQG